MGGVDLLLQEARQAGLTITVEGETLLLKGPRSAEPIVERIRQHKAEIMAALRSVPLTLVDGCQLHHITPEMVAHWWGLAQSMNAVVSMCLCCGGPSPSQALGCRRCEGEVL